MVKTAPPFVSILNQMNSVRVLQLYFFIIQFNTLSSVLVSTKWPRSCVSQPNTLHAPLPCVWCLLLSLIWSSC